MVLAGELYLYKEGERTRSFDMTSALADKSADIYFAAFDLLTLDGQEMSMDVKALDEKLNTVLSGGKSVTCCKEQLCGKQKRHCDTL